jgi:hypothetical protein
MNEIYWITRLDIIYTLTLALFIISVIAFLLSTISYLCHNGQSIHDANNGYERSSKECREYANVSKRILKYSIAPLILSTLLLIFVPTTKQAMLIYGVGGTIDYIKQNPTAKQLPDKCVKALDKWVDSWSINKSDSIK